MKEMYHYSERVRIPPSTEEVLACVRNCGPSPLDRMLNTQLQQQRTKSSTELSSQPTIAPQALPTNTVEIGQDVPTLYESKSVESP